MVGGYAECRKVVRRSSGVVGRWRGRIEEAVTSTRRLRNERYEVGVLMKTVLLAKATRGQQRCAVIEARRPVASDKKPSPRHCVGQQAPRSRFVPELGGRVDVGPLDIERSSQEGDDLRLVKTAASQQMHTGGSRIESLPITGKALSRG